MSRVRTRKNIGARVASVKHYTSSRLTLQQRVDAAAPHGEIVLMPGEYRGSLVITAPLTIVGRGRATLLQGLPGGGPVVHIRSVGVVLKDVAVEHLDADGVALLYDPDCNPGFSSVLISGKRVVRSETMVHSRADECSVPTLRRDEPARPPQPPTGEALWGRFFRAIGSFFWGLLALSARIFVFILFLRGCMYVAC